MYLASIGTYSSPPRAGGGTFTNPTGIVLGTACICQSSGTRFYFVTAIDLTISYYSISHSIFTRRRPHTYDCYTSRRARQKHSKGQGGFRRIQWAAHSCRQSSRWLSSLMLFMPSLFCCMLRRGLITVGLPPSSTEPAPLFGFVFVLAFSAALPGLLSDCTQVIAQYLIILRVAKWRALASDSISGTARSMRFKSQRSTDGDGSLSG